MWLLLKVKSLSILTRKGFFFPNFGYLTRIQTKWCALTSFQSLNGILLYFKNMLGTSLKIWGKSCVKLRWKVGIGMGTRMECCAVLKTLLMVSGLTQWVICRKQLNPFYPFETKAKGVLKLKPYIFAIQKSVKERSKY